MKIIKVLISEQALPSEKDGSWTQRIEFFLASKYNSFDTVISSPSVRNLSSTATFFNIKTIKNPLILKWDPLLKYNRFIKQLDKIQQANDKVVLCVVDNIKLQLAINRYLDKKKLKDKFIVIFYNCGYSYFLSENENKRYVKNIDELIFLTEKAYQFNKERYLDFIQEVTILHNPINKQLFYPVSKQERLKLLNKNNLEGKTIYLWLSHNRPKKGLQIVLRAWRKWALNKNNVHLLVIGTNEVENNNNISFLGKIPSNEVHEYYKMAHVYLFPTLWKEGFGLSLSQAICSGCYCIAADNGGVSEFMLPHSGLLLKNPNIVEEWVDALEIAYNENQKGWESQNPGNQILTFEEWAVQFSAIFQKWDERLKN